ncbi:hypothetical protein [Tenacibaculum sp. SG-28]|uniref:hypothetical protein n=1 Tax=Tenacibaculum sp. SG-28 TaxID=754426 RepID=UPI0011AFEBCF|nr:hypothetical protein [Tenacibaculum sp. SG-28]
MIKENKVTKYLLYAFGEIILVIIGILIALNLNQRSEQRKVEAKIDAILEDVLEELAENIENSNNLIRFYQIKDTIFNLILNDKLTYSDYANPKIQGLYNATTIYNTVTLNKYAYDNLMLNMDAIPLKYKNIVNELNILHTSSKNTVDDFSELTKNMVNNNLLERSRKFDWYSSQVPQKKNEDFLNYMLTDYTFKNKVQDFQNFGIRNHLKHTLIYRTRAVNIYQKLAELIGKSISHKSFAVDFVMTRPYLGSFKTEQAPGVIFKNYLKDDRFYATTSVDSIPQEFIFLSKSKSINLTNYSFATIGSDDEKFYFRYDQVPDEVPSSTFLRIKDSISKVD